MHILSTDIYNYKYIYTGQIHVMNHVHVKPVRSCTGTRSHGSSLETQSIQDLDSFPNPYVELWLFLKSSGHPKSQLLSGFFKVTTWMRTWSPTMGETSKSQLFVG